MACKRARSALLLTLLYYNFVYLILSKYNNGVYCLTQINHNNNYTSEPKFGDRILPRNKHQLEVHNNINENSNNNNNNNYNNNSNISVTNFTIVPLPATIITRTTRVTRIPPTTKQASLSLKSEKKYDDDDLLSTVTQNLRTVVPNRSTYKRNNKIFPQTKINSKIERDDDENVLITNDNDDENSSSAQAHRLEMSTEYFVVPSSVASMTRSTTIRPGGMILAAKTTPIPKIMNNITYPHNIGINNTGLRKEPWVIPVLVLASLSMIMMAAFELFVLFKAWRTSPSRRHLFLGQMLLLGLFSCSGLGAILTVTPTLLSCATIRFGTGVAFTLVFASLLVKCVFLISLNGGVYLPAQYQALLLLFAVLIQVAVGTQWLITSPPGVDNISIVLGGENSVTSSKYSLVFTATDVTILNPSILLCRTPYSELLLSLIYVVFLIFFVAILAIKSRRIRDNYREATYIGLSIGGIIPIWLGWTLCGLVITERHRDACLAFGLVSTSATVFLVMFMPKGRQLAAMGKEGFYVEDREEHFSSLSRTGSGYSPSFFHFKPIKYGVMGTAATTTNTNGNNNDTANKNQGVATLGGAHLTQPICYYSTQQWYPGLFIRPDDSNVYTTLEPTMSSNPNVYFQRGIHPGMMY